MILPDPKKAASIIVSRIGQEGSHEEKPEVGMGDAEQESHALGSNLLSALESKSPTAIAAAIKALIDCSRE